MSKTMTNKQTEEVIRKNILKILMNLAEEPEDIENGEGTFTTFRVEFLINDILTAIKKEH